MPPRSRYIPQSASSTINTDMFSLNNKKKQSNWLNKTCFVDKYQLLWFIAHVNTLLGFVMYVTCLLNPGKKFLEIMSWYKITNISCILTYSIVIYKRYLCDDSIERIEAGNNIFISYILKTENAQLIISAILWSVTEESIFKLIPFVIYSILNISCFFVFDAYPNETFSVALAPFICYIKDPSLVFSAFNDVAVIGILLNESYYSNSYYAFFLYVFIWGLKVENSEASRIALYKIVQFFDTILTNSYVPLKLRLGWSHAKNQICQVLSYPDICKSSEKAAFQTDDLKVEEKVVY